MHGAVLFPVYLQQKLFLLIWAAYTVDTYHLAKCERSNGTEV